MMPLCIVGAVVFGLPLLAGSVAFWVGVVVLVHGGGLATFGDDDGSEP